MISFVGTNLGGPSGLDLLLPAEVRIDGVGRPLTFSRLVHRYDGDCYAKSLTCAEQFRVMAFAQLTYRESLRHNEVCLSAQSAKRYPTGFWQEIQRSTLADATESRDRRIHAVFAQQPITQARTIYVGEALDFELENTDCVLDSTTIDLCLSVFPWAPFRLTKAAVKMHKPLDLRGNIPTFIHIPDGKLHDVNVLDVPVPEAGAIYVLDHGTWTSNDCAPSIKRALSS